MTLFLGSTDNFFYSCGVYILGPGNILTVADDLLKNDGQKFLEMMEQLAERRMAREEEAVADVEDDSEDDEDEDGDEDDEDDEDDDEDDEDEEEEVWYLFPFCVVYLKKIPEGDDGRAEDGGGQADVFDLRGTHVRAACTSGISRAGCTRATNAAIA